MLVVCAFCAIITSWTLSNNDIWNEASFCAFYDVEEMDTI
jgi:hypothetical protein